jgi:predicted ATPase/class 3 adenylate cyclase
MRGLPTGTVTFLFTDIEGSTRLWESVPYAMRAALERHDQLLAGAVREHGGVVFATGGDGIAAVFASAPEALSAAIGAQQAFVAEVWPTGAELLVRMGLHVGQAVERGGDYFGPTVNLCARLMGVAHGGQVVCSRAVAEVVGQSGAFRYLGEHRLRDLESPVHVMQVCAEGLPSEFPPLRSLERSRSNLPHELSSFVGRADDVAAIQTAIGSARVVSVIGVGGVGKTRLALRVGSELRSEFDDGVWLCELADVRDPEAVPEAVAAAFRYSPPFGVDVCTGLMQYLEHKHALLILDNCEHLVRASSELVMRLVGACAFLRVLVTSREPLGTSGERIYATPSLELPAGDDVAAIEQSEAGSLFVARAREARHGWVLDDATAPSVAEICRRLDGIPLALELAAARVATIDPPDLARRLDKRFELLAGRGWGAIERHQTLRSTIDWSYDLLAGLEQMLLHQLSCFVGGFDLEALSAVAGAAGLAEIEALDLLASLVSKSLVERDETGAGRYRLLETIRQYAAERLDEVGATAECRDRHAVYYLAFARDMLHELRGEGGFDAIERLVPDTQNVVAAMLWRGARGRASECFELFTIAPPFLLGSLPKSVTDPIARCLESLLAAVDAPIQPGFSAALCTALSLLLDADERRVTRLEDLLGRAPHDTFAALGAAVPGGRRGDMQGGRARTAVALELVGDDGDPLLRSEILALLTIYEAIADPVAGRAHGDQSVALARAHGGELARLYPLLALTLAASRTSVTHAFAAADECSSIDRTSRRLHSSVATGIAAHAAAEHGDLARAVPLWRDSVRELDRSASRMSLAITVANIADALAPGNPEMAIELVCLAESGVIAQVGVLTNEYYANLHTTAAAFTDGDLARRRAQFAAMTYEEAVAYVLGAVDRVR